MRERVPNAEFDRLDRYRVRSGLDRTVDARDARTVEVDGGLDGEGAPAGGLGGDGRGALVEALAADGGRHAAGRGGGRDARHIRSWFVKRVLRCGVRRRVMATAARPFPSYPYRANSAKRTIGHVIDIVSNGYCTVISHQTL